MTTLTEVGRTTHLPGHAGDRGGDAHWVVGAATPGVHRGSGRNRSDLKWVSK